MAKPVSKMLWTQGNPNFGLVTQEPSAGKKQNGWSAGERPPFQFFNWLFWNIGEWIDYLETTTDALLGSQAEYDAVIGTGGSHTSFSDLAADVDWLAGSIKSILVLSDITMSAPFNINQNDVTIRFKPGVSIFKGGAATRAFTVANGTLRTRILNGRFEGFAAGGDAAIEFISGCKYPMVSLNYFFNCDSFIIDSGAVAPLTDGNTQEV